MADYILLQDGTGQITLQDASGQILLQSDAGGADVASEVQGTHPFKPFGRNPYLAHAAQDESVVEPLDVPSAAVFGHPFRGLGRNRYLWNTAQDEDAPPPPPEPDIYVARLVTHQFGVLLRRPQLGWHGAIEGLEQLDDGGGGFQIVPSWDAFHLARAGRFAYWPPAGDVPAVAAEPDTWAPFRVWVPFRPLGRTPYLWHGASDESVVEPFDLPGRWVVRPFTGFQRNPYLHQPATDVDVAVVVDTTGAAFLVRVPFRAFGRSPYLTHRAAEIAFRAAFARNANVLLMPGRAE